MTRGAGRAWWPSGWTLGGLRGLMGEGKLGMLGNARVRAAGASELPGLGSVVDRRGIRSSPPHPPTDPVLRLPSLPYLHPFLTSHRLAGQQL